jgi:hypothetical protein
MLERERVLQPPKEDDRYMRVTEREVLDDARKLHGKSFPRVLQNLREGAYLQIPQAERPVVQKRLEHLAQQYISLPLGELSELGRGLVLSEDSDKPEAIQRQQDALSPFPLWQVSIHPTQLRNAQLFNGIEDEYFSETWYSAFERVLRSKETLEEKMHLLAFGPMGLLLPQNTEKMELPQRHEFQDQEAYEERIAIGIATLRGVFTDLAAISSHITFPQRGEEIYSFSELRSMVQEAYAQRYTKQSYPEKSYDPSFWDDMETFAPLAHVLIAQREALRTDSYWMFSASEEQASLYTQQILETRFLLLARHFRYLQEVTLGGKAGALPQRKLQQAFLTRLLPYDHYLPLIQGEGVFEVMTNWPDYSDDVTYLDPMIEENAFGKIQSWRRELDTTLVVANSFFLPEDLQKYSHHNYVANWIKKDLDFRSKKAWRNETGELDTSYVVKEHADEIRQIARLELIRFMKEKAPDHIADPHLFDLLEAKEYGALTEKLAEVLDPVRTPYRSLFARAYDEIFLFPMGEPTSMEEGTARDSYQPFFDKITGFQRYLGDTLLKPIDSVEMARQKASVVSLLRGDRSGKLYECLTLWAVAEFVENPTMAASLNSWHEECKAFARQHPGSQAIDGVLFNVFRHSVLPHVAEEMASITLDYPTVESFHPERFFSVDQSPVQRQVNTPSAEDMQSLRERGKEYWEQITSHGPMLETARSALFAEFNRQYPFFDSQIPSEILVLSFSGDVAGVEQTILDQLQLNTGDFYLFPIEKGKWGGVVNFHFRDGIAATGIFTNEEKIDIYLPSYDTTSAEDLLADKGLRLLLETAMFRTLFSALLSMEWEKGQLRGESIEEMQSSTIVSEVTQLDEQPEGKASEEEKQVLEKGGKQRRSRKRANEYLARLLDEL